jgi:16S rRNA (cytidine1402-2'-O)-methyltransferase
VAEIVGSRHTVVLYEAPPRVAETLAELAAAGAGEREAVVARELTKQFEEVRRGTVAALAGYYADAPARGEVVLIIAGARPVALDETVLRDRARVLRAQGASARDVARTLIAESGAPRNLAYRLATDA